MIEEDGRVGRTGSALLRTLFFCITVKIGWAANPYPLPDARIPDGIGINLHLIPHRAEIKEVAAAGFRWIRLDFHWNEIERSPGQYDWFLAILSGLMIIQLGN